MLQMPGADGCWHPIFSSWKGPKEIWAMAAEKAWAKLHGSYETVEAGSAEDTLAYLTGGCSETYRTGVWAGREDKLWETCLAAYKTASSEQGLFLAAGDANGLSTNNSDSEDGLVAGHAYSVLGLKVVDGFMLINLRNPWGKGEWTGAWSDQSELWTPTRRKQAGFVGVADDGSFWMAWPDFMKHFGHIGLCRLPPRKWHVVSCQGAFQTGKTAGGEDSPTVACNPTFYLENTVDQVEVVVEQPDSRSNTGPGYHPIGLRVLKLPADGDKIEANPPTALPMQQTGFNRQTRYTLQLDPREGPYLLLFTLWRSGVTHRVHVTAASPQPIKMKKTKQYRPKISTEMAAKMKAPKMPIGCVTCGKPAFGDHIAALYGLRWHKASACCRCEACKKPFTQDAGHSLYMPGVEAGRWGVYCWGCHNDKFGKKCVQCGEKLHMLQADGEKVYLIPSGEGKLHGRCRDEYAKAKAEPCTQCKKPLSGKYYVLEGDVKVHDECYVVFKVAAAKKCLHCSEPVFAIPGKYEGKYYVTKDGAQIHEECYAAHLRSQAPECIQCHETIVDSEYFKIDGGAKGCVHKACYEMYKIGQAPQCVHCRGAILELTGKYSGRYYDLKEKGKVHEECYHDFKKGPIMQGV